jgi:hypothetical protein
VFQQKSRRFQMIATTRTEERETIRSPFFRNVGIRAVLKQQTNDIRMPFAGGI